MDRPSRLEPAAEAPTAARVTLNCLGPAAVVRAVGDSRVLTLFGPGKPLAVLTLLVLAPSRTVSRDRLVDLLWANHDITSGRKQLRSALHYIRSSIGAWAIDAGRQTCTASPDITADVVEFRTAVEGGDFPRALGIYRGDFLPDFASPDCREFESWADKQRGYFRSLASGAAELLSHQALDSGRFREARKWAHRLREIDVDSELGWRLGLQATVATGDLASIAAEAELFETWLAEEQREPEAASLSALAAARRRTEPAPAEHANNHLLSELVGRESEFKTVLDAWSRARSGRAQAILLTGPSGLGKTRLLRDLENRLRSERARVIAVRGFIGERGVPYSFIVALIHELARLRGAKNVTPSVAGTLVGIDPRLSAQYPGASDDAPAHDVLNRRSVAVRELVIAVSTNEPLALLLDDVHWIDDRSRLVLAAAFARELGDRLLLVAASRTSLAGMVGEVESTEVALRPLLESDVALLLAFQGTFASPQAWPSLLVLRLTETTKGNPLLLLVTLQQLVSEGLIELRKGEWQCENPHELDARLAAIDPMESRMRALTASQFRALVLCAVAGIPLPRTLLASILHVDGFDDRIQTLEHTAHLTESPSGLEVAHDAIAECALRIAGEKLVREARAELGAELVKAGEESWVRRGIRHLLDADALGLACQTIAELIRHSPLRGSARIKTASILDCTPSDERVDRVLRHLPFASRFRARGIAAASIAVMATVLSVRGIVVAARPPMPDAVFELRQFDATGSVRNALVSLTSKDWAEGRLPKAVFAGEARIDTVLRAEQGSRIKPGEDAWLVEREGNDSAGINIEVRRVGGTTDRLTALRFEMGAEAWSPDGRQIALTTTQFGDSGHRAIGILSLPDRRIRKFNSARETQLGPRWSVDGTRLAYSSRQSDTDRVCIAPVDGSRSDCRMLGVSRFGIIGWIDERHILIGGEAGPVEYDAVSHQVVPFEWSAETGSPASLSPDGQWAIFSKPPGDGEDQLRVARTNDLAHLRRIVLSGATKAPVSFNWRGTAARRVYLDSISIDAKSDSISVGEPFQLGVSGYTSERQRTSVNALAWRSLNPTVAAIDSNGVVRALQPGIVWIEASAGGWRTTRRSFRSVPITSREVLTENWHDPFASRWKPFGRPFPRIVEDSVLGPSFLNNGDGTYFSGAYSVMPLDGRQGLALDVVVRIHVTSVQWQYMQVNLQRLPNPGVLAQRWDHVTGYIGSGIGGFPPGSGCNVAYPKTEGAAAVRQMSIVDELPRRSGAQVPDIATGLPTKIRVQLFPDGRCGVAVDGVALAITTFRLATSDSLYVLLQGNSVGTRALVGPVRVRTGVPADIDWSRAPSR